MTRKINEENERIKRRYAQYLRAAKRLDYKSIDKAMDAVLQFERSTKYKPFRLFHLEQAVVFVEALEIQISKTTGKPLSKPTIASTLRAVRNFIHWLAGQQGYKSRISYSDSEYFNLNLKDSRIANHRKEIPYPSLEQCWLIFDAMLDGSDIERRNKAFFAFLMITALRDGAIASLKLKHIDLVDGSVHQDAREVKTKFSKTFTVWFMPVNQAYTDYFEAYVTHMRETLLFGPEDPLFPRPKMVIGNTGGFQTQGLSRDMYASANALRLVLGKAFEASGMPKYPPHSFRKTITKWGQGYYRTPEGLKALSQNLGHESVTMTIDSYCPVSQEDQKKLIKKKKN
jgi:integrase